MNDQVLTGVASVFGVAPQLETVLSATKAALSIYSADVDGELVVLPEHADQATSYRSALDVHTDLEVFTTISEWEALLTPTVTPTINAGAAKSIRAAVTAAKNAAPAIYAPFPSKVADPAQAASRTYRPVPQVGQTSEPTFGNMLQDLCAGKSQNYELGPNGGYVVRERMAETILEPLRAQLVLEKVGATVYNLTDAAVMTVPKMTGVPVAQWVGVNQAADETDVAYDQITITPKPISLNMTMPKRWLATAFAQAEAQVTRQSVLSLKLALEYAALMGTGAVSGSNPGGQPLGIFNTTGVTKTSLGTNGKKPTLSDLQLMYQRMAEDNIVDDGTRAYIMAPRDAWGYRRLTDSIGQPLLRDNFINGIQSQMIDGTMVESTTQIPINITTGTANNTSYIFAGMWSSLWLAYGGGIEVQVYNQDFTLGSKLNVGIVVHTYMDTGIAYPEAFQVLTGVLPVS